MNILIGEITSYKAIIISRYIKKIYPNFSVYTYDYRKFTKIFRTKFSDRHFYLNKNGKHQEQIKGLIKKYKIDIFFPVINEDLKEIWRNKDEYGDSLNYLGKFESYIILNDKIKLHELASKLNIQTPQKYKNIEQSKIPFVAKPTNMSSSKGLIYVNKKNDILKIPQNQKLIFQEFVGGEGVGYSFYAKEGKILNGFGHKRLSEFPASGGSSTYRMSYKDYRMEKIASKIIKELNYSGFAMFEFKLTNKNELFLIEVNPRIWGSINQGLVNGNNYFAEILGYTKLVEHKNNVNLETYLSPLIYLSFLKYILNGRLTPIFLFILNTRKRKADVSIIKDFKGFLSLILRKIIR